jgi:hypothetical protein
MGGTSDLMGGMSDRMGGKSDLMRRTFVLIAEKSEYPT